MSYIDFLAYGFGTLGLIAFGLVVIAFAFVMYREFKESM